ncbi:SDR family oxidoreductase [Pseudomonas umsongensis]|jgi:NAD(P)-dependent dehydrogenase (short-subunit alcohol dehydrogenase family)|uniref:SDR family oxidoreductase n=1 Tax=Pseudomonas umsongensis TaxID=198618 RepID=UPI0015C0CD19|nr:SDR family oxidoreductase [Pseudomonas umsongensis]NWL18096.1 short-chain dehydrogenase [Pseudomonas umsongensis]
MTSKLTSKTAIVTGAAQGIGAAIVRLFAQEDCFVYVTDINDELGRYVADSLGDHASYLRLDVRREDDWQRVTTHILKERGRLDVLVNNAGITGFEHGAVPHDPEHARLEDWHAVHQTNLDGVFLGCKYAIRAMRHHGTGSIINISSRSGLVGIPGAAAYASSKAAVRNHTKTVALYCAGQGLKVRCNSIHPAAILTPMWEPMLGTGVDRQERMAALVRDTPLRRFAMPEEVAALALLLASDEATYMTGSELNIDGGLLAGTAATPAAVDDTGD